MPSASSCRKKPSLRFSPPASASARVLENVVLDAYTREPDFDDGSKTENTRSALSARIHSQRLAHRPPRLIRRIW